MAHSEQTSAIYQNEVMSTSGKLQIMIWKSCPFSHHPHFLRNQSACLFPQQQSGILLHLRPGGKQTKNTLKTEYKTEVFPRSKVGESNLACSDQLVVSELCQLSPQREVRVHQEGLSTALVEVLEWQACIWHNQMFKSSKWWGENYFLPPSPKKNIRSQVWAFEPECVPE